MKTSDTEWEKEFENTFDEYFFDEDLGEEGLFAPRERIKDFITKVISSRDTYWKERVKEERMRARQEVQIKQEIGQLGFQVIVATLVNTPVEMERIKSKMAQALKEAIADNLIR